MKQNIIIYLLVVVFNQKLGVHSLQGPQLRMAKAAVAELLDQLRPDAVALVDAFDFPDRVLASAIGRYDGMNETFLLFLADGRYFDYRVERLGHDPDSI